MWQLHIEKPMYYIGISFSVLSLMCLFKVCKYLMCKSSVSEDILCLLEYIFFSVCLLTAFKEQESTANYLHIKTSKYSFLCWSFPNHEQIFYCFFDAANFHFPYQAPWITHLFTNWFHGSPLCFLLDPVRAFVIEIWSLKKIIKDQQIYHLLSNIPDYKDMKERSLIPEL